MGRRARNRPPGRTQAPDPQSRGCDSGPRRPGTITKGPPITVTCECGARKELFYGERWTCPDCGRAYDTSHIPAEEYQAIRRLQMRYRALPVAIALSVALLAIVFTLTGNVVGVFFIMPVAIISWFVFLRPTHRKRYRAAIADLPRWDLRAD